jgi:hypothetical protein
MKITADAFLRLLFFLEFFTRNTIVEKFFLSIFPQVKFESAGAGRKSDFAGLLEVNEKSTNLPQDFHKVLHTFFHKRRVRNSLWTANT